MEEGVTDGKRKENLGVKMKMIKNVLILVLLSTFVVGCGLKGRRAEIIHSQYPEWDQATVQAVAARKVSSGNDQTNGDGSPGKPRLHKPGRG